MATVHCENGKFHVHYELYKASNQNKDGKKNPSDKGDEVLSLHIQGKGDGLDFIFWSKTVRIIDNSNFDSPYIRLSIPPPKVA